MLRFFRPARALPLVIAVLLAAPAAANAWQVTVRVHGAGKVAEISAAGLMDCTTPSGVAETTVTSCVAGSTNGDYGHGWIVELEASVPDAYFDRGWRFSKWVDGTGFNKINCDPQDATGDHFGTKCKFQIFDNGTVDLYFDDFQGPQDTSLSGGPTGPTNNTSAMFNFNSGDPDANYECRLDRPGMPVGAWLTCGSPFDKSESYSGLTTNGQYTFLVRGRDLSGNFDSTPESRTWTVDTVGPATSINGGPANGSRTTNTFASFSLTANESASFQCKLDAPSGGGVFGPCGSSPGYTSLADGTYTFSARGVDNVGNLGPAVSRTWTVDTQPPDTTITGGPFSVSSSNSPTFGVASSESNSTFECKLDGGAWEPCTSTKGYTSLSEGEHTFRVRATDATGLTDATEAVRTWTVDTVTPDTSITSGPSGDTTSTAATFEFSASEPGTTFECKLDGGSWESCTSGKTYSGLAAGPHTFLVRATDAAGNADQSEAVRSWTVTSTPPGGTPPGGTPPPGSADTTKPVAALTFGKQRLPRVLTTGFVGSAASSEAGKLRLDVLLARGLAKRLKLAGPSAAALVVATSKTRALGGPGSMKLTAKFTRKARRALARVRTLRLTLRLTATDAAGNVSVKTRSVTLRR
jgi:hypothetical protein